MTRKCWEEILGGSDMFCIYTYVHMCKCLLSYKCMFIALYVHRFVGFSVDNLYFLKKDFFSPGENTHIMNLCLLRILCRTEKIF